MLKIVQKVAKMTKIAPKKAKTVKKLLEKPKISTPVKKIALTASATFSIFVFHLALQNQLLRAVLGATSKKILKLINMTLNHIYI